MIAPVVLTAPVPFKVLVEVVVVDAILEVLDLIAMPTSVVVEVVDDVTVLAIVVENAAVDV